jgi:hypothetical protein
MISGLLFHACCTALSMVVVSACIVLFFVVVVIVYLSFLCCQLHCYYHRLLCHSLVRSVSASSSVLLQETWRRRPGNRTIFILVLTLQQKNFIHQAHPDLPGGKAIIAQNLIAYHHTLTQAGLLCG